MLAKVKKEIVDFVKFCMIFLVWFALLFLVALIPSLDHKITYFAGWVVFGSFTVVTVLTLMFNNEGEK